jgi:hypothetical protein
MISIRLTKSHYFVARSHVPERLFTVALYVFALLGAFAGVSSLLSETTEYGLGYGLWFAGLVVLGTAIALGPLLGARVGGLDWDRETTKEIHLSGQSLPAFQMRALTIAIGSLGCLLAAGVASAGCVGLVAAIGGGRWQGDADLVSAMAATRLVLGAVLGLPFSVVCGWAAAIFFRSSHKAALFVESSLILYVATVGLTYLSPVMDALYRYSPWGALMGMLVGGYRPPSLVVDPSPGLALSVVLTLAWLAVLLLMALVVMRRRDVGGGRRA